MKILPPMMISSRLLPAVKIADCTISVEPSERRGNRLYWRYHFDRPGKKSYSGDDLSTAAGFALRNEGDCRSAVSSILSFLSAAVEARKGRERRGAQFSADSDSGENLFPRYIVRFFSEHRDELEMISSEFYPFDN